jgi:hypothetical protein
LLTQVALKDFQGGVVALILEWDRSNPILARANPVMANNLRVAMTAGGTVVMDAVMTVVTITGVIAVRTVVMITGTITGVVAIIHRNVRSRLIVRILRSVRNLPTIRQTIPHLQSTIRRRHTMIVTV